MIFGFENLFLQYFGVVCISNSPKENVTNDEEFQQFVSCDFIERELRYAIFIQNVLDVIINTS